MTQASDRPKLVTFRDVKGEEIARRGNAVVVDPRTGEPVAPGSNLGVVVRDER